jgi:hypothetical protein
MGVRDDIILEKVDKKIAEAISK